MDYLNLITRCSALTISQLHQTMSKPKSVKLGKFKSAYDNNNWLQYSGRCNNRQTYEQRTLGN